MSDLASLIKECIERGTSVGCDFALMFHDCEFPLAAHWSAEIGNTSTHRVLLGEIRGVYHAEGATAETAVINLLSLMDTQPEATQ